MAYSIIDRSIVSFSKAHEIESGYFNGKDMEILLEQPGAVGLKVVNLKVSIPEGEVECLAMVAIADKTALGPTSYMDKDGDLVAVVCPPYTDTIGGTKIDLGEKTKAIVEGVVYEQA